MNIPVILRNAGKALKSAAGNGALLAKKHAPELLVGSGIVGFVATVFEACKATEKAHDILEERDHLITVIEKENEENPIYTEEEYEADLKGIKKHARKKLIMAYLPTGTTGVASVILVLGGYRLLNGRYIATAAAYKTLEAGYERYRGNVIDEFGEEVDWRMRNGVRVKDMEKAQKERDENREIAADNRRKKRPKRTPKTAYQEIYSQIFDQYSDHWKRWWTPDQVLDYLRLKQRHLNDKLKIQKHLFLNEVYDELGLERTSEGAVVGWILTRNNPNSYVSLGIDEMPEEEIRRILSSPTNDDIWIRLHPNPDGLIYTLIDKTDPELEG